MASEHVRDKWRLLVNSRRQDSNLMRRQLDLDKATATGSGSDTSTRDSYVDYDWSSPSKNSERWDTDTETKYIEVEPYDNKDDDDSIHFCVKMDREFLYVLTFLALLYLFSQFSKKDFLKKFLTSLVKRRRRSVDDVREKWRILNSRRPASLRRRQLDLGNELSSAATATGSGGDTSTRDSYVDYDWSSPSKNSETWKYIEVEPYDTKKGDDDESIHFCLKMDREFLYVLTFLSLLYLFSTFSKKDFLKKFLVSLVTRRRRSVDDINLGAFCEIDH